MRQEFIKFPLHLILHPFDGYWDIKFEGRGRFKVAALLIVLLVLARIAQREYGGYLVNYTDMRHYNSLSEALYVLVPLALWCVSNWSMTTLMDGEGKFGEIVKATAYAVLPLILIYVPTTIASHAMVQQEVAFYYLLNTIAAVWCAWLLFVGTMTVHQYSVGKTVFTMLLTLIVMGIIIFLALLFFTLVQQMVDFLHNLYLEYEYRK